jgi:hypothetical protein
MSAAPFDPTSDYIPAPDPQTSNAAPGPVGVMAPDQPQAPAAQPQADPSSDAYSPAAPGDPDAGSSTHGWRAVLKGALSGLENHLKGAGEGALMGGIPGAIAGGLSPNSAGVAWQQEQQMRQARADAMTANARSAMADAAVKPEDDKIQLAQAQIHLQQLQRIYDNTSPDFQTTLQREGAQAGQQLKDSGITPTFTGNEADAQAHMQTLMSINADNPLNIVAFPTGKPGEVSVYQIPSDQKYFNHDVTLTVGHDESGKPITQKYPRGTITISRAINLESAALVEEGKVSSKIRLANATGVTNKNNAAANKANNAASATPKVENLLVGADADGNQVAGTKDELTASGVKNISKLPAADASKVVAARELVSPDGLFSLIAKDMTALGPQGLNAVGSRFNEFVSGQVGQGDDNYTRLRTHVKLLSSALMQAHVGSRGSEAMLNEFHSLADQEK